MKKIRTEILKLIKAEDIEDAVSLLNKLAGKAITEGRRREKFKNRNK